MRQISGMDDIFLHFERSGLPMHVGSVTLYHPPSSGKGPPDFSQIRESIRRGVRRAPILRQRLVNTPLHLDRPHWIDTRDFDLDDHIRRVSLPNPATWGELCAVVARIFEEPLDLARPLFEVNVIENLDGIEGLPPGTFALMTKVHHAALDGVSAVEIMRTFCDASEETESSEPDDEEAKAGLIVIQEWWGLTDDIKEIADRYSVEGYSCFAPDLYHGQAATEPDEARKLAMAMERDVASQEIDTTGFAMA